MKFDVRDLSFGGGMIGIVLFVLFGLTPSIAYGSTTAVSIMKDVITDDTVIVGGALLGAVVCLFVIAGTFTAVFAMLGATVGTIRKRMID